MTDPAGSDDTGPGDPDRLHPRVRAEHDDAVAAGRDAYRDPLTGYSVFTELYLSSRPCCGEGCRHCPYD